MVLEKKQHLKLVCKDFVSVNHYMNYRVQGKIVMVYKPKTTKDFEKRFGEYIKQEIVKQGWVRPPKDKLIIIDSTFYFPRIDMDAQNYFKTICDVGTQSGIWEDDNITMERVNRIYYDSKNPRIEFDIYESDFIGVFSSQNEYIEFKKENCDKCKKKSDGSKGSCTILKQLLENRIIDNVCELEGKWTCNKIKAK